MKSISNSNYILFSVLSILLFTGCDKELLDQKNPNSITPKTFWRNSDDAKKGIIGAYSPLDVSHLYGRHIVFATDYRDDIVNPFATSPRTEPARFQGDSGSKAVRQVWIQLWNVISRSNEVLYHVPKIEMNDGLKNNILGEALYLRALSYFELVNLWRNVPLIVAPISIKESKEVSQFSPKEVWEQIISDLKEAVNLLPTSWSGDDLGRATSGAAIAMLGKAYLFTSNYDMAKNTFQQIIDNPRYELMKNYSDNFSQFTENNKESIFEIQMLSDGNQDYGPDRAGTGRALNLVLDFAPPGFTNQNSMRINQWVLDLFLDERTINGEIDPRAFVTMFWNTDETTVYQGKILSSKTYKDLTYAEAFSISDTRIFGNKYIDSETGVGSAVMHQSSANWRLIRYADVLLMYAEADMMINGGGATQTAVDAVNQVRRRVDMPDFDFSMTMQDLMDERVKELALEHVRWYDLLRWNMVKERVVDVPGIKSESGGIGSYAPGREYLDIPQVDLDNNVNFKHNPGY